MSHMTASWKHINHIIGGLQLWHVCSGEELASTCSTIGMFDYWYLSLKETTTGYYKKEEVKYMDCAVLPNNCYDKYWCRLC